MNCKKCPDFQVTINEHNEIMEICNAHLYHKDYKSQGEAMVCLMKQIVQELRNTEDDIDIDYEDCDDGEGWKDV